MRDIAAHIMDIVQNSIRANASKIEIRISINSKLDCYTLTIIDNGNGMNKETLTRIADPFYTSRTVRKVGLGISLLKQNAEATGGDIEVNSGKDKGTTVTANFILSHIDIPPEGDIPSTIIMLLTANPNIEFVYKYTNNGEFIFDSTEIKDFFGDISLNNPDIYNALKELISTNTLAVE